MRHKRMLKLKIRNKKTNITSLPSLIYSPVQFHHLKLYLLSIHSKNLSKISAPKNSLSLKAFKLIINQEINHNNNNNN